MCFECLLPVVRETFCIALHSEQCKMQLVVDSLGVIGWSDHGSAKTESRESSNTESSLYTRSFPLQGKQLDLRSIVTVAISLAIKSYQMEIQPESRTARAPNKTLM